MFEKILFPTDFSDVAKKAQGFVKKLKEAGCREITLLHVVDQSSLDVMSSIGSVPDYISLAKEMENNASNELAGIEDEFKNHGFTVKSVIRQGVPLREILATAHEDPSAVIVIGSHGKSNIKEMLLGSVSEKVIRKAKNPVLVVKR